MPQLSKDVMSKVEGISIIAVEYARDHIGQKGQSTEIVSMTEKIIDEIAELKTSLFKEDGQFASQSKRLDVISEGLENLKTFVEDDQSLTDFAALHPAFDLSDLVSPTQILTFVPRWPMVVNIISAVLCLGLSAVFHQFSFYSKHVCDKLATFDYGGICILIMGSCYPPIFYPFACQPFFETRNSFMIIITVACVGAFLSLLNDKLASSECRAYRGIMFVGLGLSAIFPLAYLNMIDGGDYISYFSVQPYLVGGIFYIGGAVLYVLRLPERLAPRRFDLVGSSHQLFHVGVVIGAFVHFMAGYELYQKRTEMVCPVELPSVV